MTRTAVVHEWFSPHGGSENVAELLARHVDADIFTLWRDAARAEAPDLTVHESWLARTPLRRHKVAALPFMSHVWRHLDLGSYDRIIASTHLFAHHALSAPGVRDKRLFAYVHTPARYLWAPDQDVRGDRWWAKLAAKPLQSFDRARVAHGASFAANSAYIADRVRRTWDVEARVIHPPVDVARIQSEADWAAALSGPEHVLIRELPEHFVLGASRLIAYKELEQAMFVGEDLDLPVVIVGSGPDESRLRHLAAQRSVPVTFVGALSPEALFAVYQRATLYVFPAVEDFGIMPVEAMAAGTPVLVNERGGAGEAVELTRGGIVTDFASTTDRRMAAREALSLDAAEFTRRTQLLDTAHFLQHVDAWVI